MPPTISSKHNKQPRRSVQASEEIRKLSEEAVEVSEHEPEPEREASSASANTQEAAEEPEESKIELEDGGEGSKLTMEEGELRWSSSDKRW